MKSVAGTSKLASCLFFEDILRALEHDVCVWRWTFFAVVCLNPALCWQEVEAVFARGLVPLVYNVLLPETFFAVSIHSDKGACSELDPRGLVVGSLSLHSGE